MFKFLRFVRLRALHVGSISYLSIDAFVISFMVFLSHVQLLPHLILLYILRLKLKYESFKKFLLYLKKVCLVRLVYIGTPFKRLFPFKKILSYSGKVYIVSILLLKHKQNK